MPIQMTLQAGLSVEGVVERIARSQMTIEKKKKKQLGLCSLRFRLLLKPLEKCQRQGKQAMHTDCRELFVDTM